MLILPNEWVLDYLTPGTNKPQLSEAFLRECRSRGHILLMRRESNFRTKLFRYSRLYPNLLDIGRFVSLSLRDFELFRIIEETEMSPDIPNLASIPADDRYLVEVLWSFRDAILVTTDGFLQGQVVALDLRAVLFQDDVQVVMARIEDFATK